ncbi:MAG: hypothetical protein M3680_11800 [Myxococcota bacterium]|nr:hypothetical protein [Myxococcota bacterium]
MRVRLNRWLLPIGLATATLVGTVSTAAAQPVVRDHRGPRDRVRQPDGPPREAPPAPRAERQGGQRRGFVWVSGHWDWNGGRWQWTSGRWEREQRGRRWRPHTWENRDGFYVRINGDWIDDRPTQAPPAPREERFEQRRGWTWMAGHWDWRNGQYVWVDGKWERERRGKRWRRANWEQRDGAWIRVDGGWDTDAGGGITVQYPTQAPPPPRVERQAPRQGFVWISGRHEWRNGNYEWVSGRWERERANERYVDGRWEYRDQRWMWIDGRWDRGSATPMTPSTQVPVQAPPPPREERYERRDGFVWARGHYEWRGGQYEWIPGHWERVRANQSYEPPRWELRGKAYVKIEGGWR